MKTENLDIQEDRDTFNSRTPKSLKQEEISKASSLSSRVSNCGAVQDLDRWVRRWTIWKNFQSIFSWNSRIYYNNFWKSVLKLRVEIIQEYTSQKKRKFFKNMQEILKRIWANLMTNWTNFGTTVGKWVVSLNLTHLMVSSLGSSK